MRCNCGAFVSQKKFREVSSVEGWQVITVAYTRCKRCQLDVFVGVISQTPLPKTHTEYRRLKIEQEAMLREQAKIQEEATNDFIKQFEQLKAEYLLTLDDSCQLVSNRQFADMRLTQFLDWLRAKQDKAWQPVEWHKRQWEL